ncbi:MULTISPECIES: DUF4250 domain-containing protein [unclassified Butyrivibrio]|uniref:DUF4250 domain-containing protein n=1 Tax=unclassified Butyrivibrio TaxID=2639466 RepID=UPI0003B55126|nr:MULTISPECIES: DUF4250 domain-containing protein [unclassified Butyrivibrio]SEK63039.1 protein of unknown function [Butyrivibrio sp. ob235]
MIPKDPIMLLSYINTQLRDNYSSLDALAEGLDIGKDELDGIVAKLNGIGYVYNPDSNKFA